jgi:transcriptional regulator with GAF, ATPase, and Fis domain
MSATKHSRLNGLRNNADYFFIGDQSDHTYHRKDSDCVERHVTKNSMVGLGRELKGYRPCPFCRPDQIEVPEPEPKRRRKKSKSNLIQDELTRIAEEYGLHLEFIGPNVYVTTVAGEWYFDYNIRPIVLHHKNNRVFLAKNGKPRNYYHEQEHTFPNPLEVIKYIFRHERAAVQRGFQDEEDDRGPVLLTLAEAVEAAERQAILAALGAASSKKAAAEILGISVDTLRRKRRKYGIGL